MNPTSLSVPQGSRFDIALEKGGESRQLACLARLHSIQQNVVGIVWFQVTAVSTQLFRYPRFDVFRYYVI